MIYGPHCSDGMCGDPWCTRCYPRNPVDNDPDEAYEIKRQKELDDECENVK